MQEENKNSSSSIKFFLILLSIIIVGVSLTGNILISDKGGVPLLSFERFYVYIITIGISLYMALNKKVLIYQ